LHGFTLAATRRISSAVPADKVAVGLPDRRYNPYIVARRWITLLRVSLLLVANTNCIVLQGIGDDRSYVWTIDGDRRGNYNFSNVVGPQLHGYSPTK